MGHVAVGTVRGGRRCGARLQLRGRGSIRGGGRAGRGVVCLVLWHVLLCGAAVASEESRCVWKERGAQESAGSQHLGTSVLW